MKYITIFFFLLVSFDVFAQSEIKMMQYNVLYYDKIYSGCDEVSNNVDEKNAALRTIMNYERPDILCVNEMNDTQESVDKLRDEVLNINGIDYYKSSTATGSFSINAFYYDSRKIRLRKQTAFAIPIGGNQGLVDIYFLDILTEPISTMAVMVTHLKAGSDEAAMTDRKNSTALLIDLIKNNLLQGETNYTFSGDFNLYGASEQSYQNLIHSTTPGIIFYDPVNQEGEWNNNCTYAPYHTQSTHSSSNGCASTGSLDDRFDFILVSSAIQNHTKAISYSPTDYVTVGQDGEHCNSSLTSDTNNSAPEDVINALYKVSDHLPVTLKFQVDYDLTAVEEINPTGITFNNPVHNNLIVNFENRSTISQSISIYTINGQLIYKNDLKRNTGNLNVDFSNRSKGIYFMEVSDKNAVRRYKIIKN